MRIRSLIEYHDVAARNRAHGQLLVPGQSQLSHDKHIEWRAEFARDFEGDRHAAARQSEARSHPGAQHTPRDAAPIRRPRAPVGKPATSGIQPWESPSLLGC